MAFIVDEGGMIVGREGMTGDGASSVGRRGNRIDVFRVVESVPVLLKISDRSGDRFYVFRTTHIDRAQRAVNNKKWQKR